MTIAVGLGLPGIASADIVSAHLVSRVGDDGPATSAPKRARVDEGVTLYAVLGAKTDGKLQYFSDAGRIELGKNTIETRPMSEAPDAILLWNKIEPTTENMSNTESGKFRFEAIDYAATPIATWLYNTSLAADVRPTLTSDYGDGVGTMRYQLRVVTPTATFETPGIDSRRGRGSGGLSDSVLRVSLRKDDTYLGYLTEMYGQPYIWASAGKTDRSHQSEHLEGSDCADFVVYGIRRVGKKVSYTWTGGLDDYTKTLARGEPNADGIYVDAKANQVPFPKVGDLILFPRHVGVLVEDRGVKGVLDHDDVMVHTLFQSPHEQPIGEVEYYSTLPIETLRWD